MKPLILTISGYFLIIIFIIFTLVFPVSLDSDAWYDWISWMMLILSLILNILCFFISVFYIKNKRRTWANIIACILSIVFMIIAFSLVSIETVIVVNWSWNEIIFYELQPLRSCYPLSGYFFNKYMIRSFKKVGIGRTTNFHSCYFYWNYLL